MSDRERQAVLIEHYLSEIEASLEKKGRTNDFIESLRDQFDRKGHLSEKQVRALESYYDRID
jgi:hypothetical protein